jgi:hypothetical protein
MQYTACVKTLSPSGRLKTAFWFSNPVFKALESHEIYRQMPAILGEAGFAKSGNAGRPQAVLTACLSCRFWLHMLHLG